MWNLNRSPTGGKNKGRVPALPISYFEAYVRQRGDAVLILDKYWRVSVVYGSLGIPREVVYGMGFYDFIAYPVKALLCEQNAAEVKYFGGTKSMIAPIHYNNRIYDFYFRFQLFGVNQVVIRSKYIKQNEIL